MKVARRFLLSLPTIIYCNYVRLMQTLPTIYMQYYIYIVGDLCFWRTSSGQDQVMEAAKKMGLAARRTATGSQKKKRCLVPNPPSRARGSIKRKVFVLLFKKLKFAANMPFITCLATRTSTTTAVTHPPRLI